MKVLHIHAETLYGGVETFLLTLARERHLCPEMEPMFALCYDQRLTGELREAGSPVTLLGEPRLSRPLSVLLANRLLGKWIDEHSPDVIVSHMPKPYSLFAGLIRRRRIPHVLYLHMPLSKTVFETLAAKTPVADLMVGVSAHTAQTGREFVFPQAKTTVIHCLMPWPVSRYAGNAEQRQEVRREFETAEEDVVLIQASRLAAWKGHVRLLDALGHLKDVPGWVFWAVGGPQTDEEVSYFEGLKAQADRLGIRDRIRFAGQRKDVPRLLPAADIYCQANTASEGFSMSFIEAFSAGLPVVTTDIGSAREAVSEDVGFTTPVGDAPAFAAALKTLITDPERREKMGDAARKRVVALCDTAQQIRRLHDECRQLL
ncbi:MAG: glycosyltransferase [Capsulimonadales bacterium]|nr:glycosyltransferase [Capsulimonadales bacterium]